MKTRDDFLTAKRIKSKINLLTHVENRHII